MRGGWSHDQTWRYPQELRERAVRMVFEHQDEHDPQWAAVCSIANKVGVSHETLRSRPGSVLPVWSHPYVRDGDF